MHRLPLASTAPGMRIPAHPSRVLQRWSGLLHSGSLWCVRLRLIVGGRRWVPGTDDGRVLLLWRRVSAAWIEWCPVPPPRAPLAWQPHPPVPGLMDSSLSYRLGVSLAPEQFEAFQTKIRAAMMGDDVEYQRVIEEDARLGLGTHAHTHTRTPTLLMRCTLVKIVPLQPQPVDPDTLPHMPPFRIGMTAPICCPLDPSLLSASLVSSLLSLVSSTYCL